MMKKLKIVLYPICVLLLLIAGWNLWKIKSSTDHTQKLYTNLAKETETESADNEKSTETESSTNSWLTELQNQNDELVAWIKIPGTVIDYPVMQTGSDNDYYLTHNFNKEEDAHGAPFLDVNCKIGESENLIIYGHHMKDKTMFQNLMLYKDADFCESNGTIEFYTPTESSKYQVIFVILITAEQAEKFPYYKCVDLSNDEVYEGFFQQCSRYAIWQSDDLPSAGTNLITLSTCEYSQTDGRLVVVASQT